jgi:hypothetical protein
MGHTIATSVIAFLRPERSAVLFPAWPIRALVPMVVAIFIVLRLLWRWVRGETPLRDQGMRSLVAHCSG